MATSDDLEPILGIPYAYQAIVGRKTFAVCPRCAEQIELVKRKDFESASSDAYATHYLAAHAAADGLVQRDGRWFRPRGVKP
jgi:hypothetical protein